MSRTTYDEAVAARDTQIPITNAAHTALASAKAAYRREPTDTNYAALVAANKTATDEQETLATLESNIRTVLKDDVPTE